MEIVIALDQGSSSSRALAFDQHGRVVTRAQVPVKTFFPRSGWVEHDPEDLIRTSERALDFVLRKLPRKAQVLGMGIAAQRSTVVLWDANTGKAVARAPSWQDARASAMVSRMRDRQQGVYEKTGLYLTPFYSAPKIRFLLDHEPKARALLEKGRLRVGPVSTYLLWRLSQGKIFSVDPSMAQRTLLYNLHQGDWDSELLEMFAVTRESLPHIVPTTCAWGELLRAGREIPVLASLGDQQSAALGQGSEPGVGVLNYGTGAFFLLNTGQDLMRVPGLLTSVVWRKEGAGCSYFLEGTVHAAGTSFEWLKKNLRLLKDVRRLDALCRASTQRLLMLQALGGLGAPRWDYHTPTVFWGLNARTQRADLVRAAAESIAFLIADIVSAIQGAGLPLEAVKASGGLARLDYLMQFQADLLQRPITRLEESEATAMGAAALAAEQAGAPWAKALKRGGVSKEFKPKLAAKEAADLLSAWQLFVEAQQKLGERLRPLGI